MSKINPWGRPRIASVPETFKLTAADGTEYEFTLRRLGPLEDARAADRMEELVGRYIGYPANPQLGFEGQAPTDAFPAAGDPPRAVELSRRLFDVVAGIEAMQPKDLPADSRYSAEELVAIGAVDVDVWNALIARAGRINRGGKEKAGQQGNPCAEDSGEKSGQASATSTGIQS